MHWWHSVLLIFGGTAVVVAGRSRLVGDGQAAASAIVRCRVIRMATPGIGPKGGEKREEKL